VEKPTKEKPMNINWSDFSESKYLRKEDLDRPILVTIKGFTKENVARDGEPPQVKVVMHFQEAVKPMVVNPTNAELIRRACGVMGPPSDCIGHLIVLFRDDTVTMGGKPVGGIRVRAPKKKAHKPVQIEEPKSDDDDDWEEPKSDDDEDWEY
jgi:hypothetical protein